MPDVIPFVAGRRPLVVVSNRVPHHQLRTAGHRTTSSASGGAPVALDAAMRERGVVWVAHSAGDASPRLRYTGFGRSAS